MRDLTERFPPHRRRIGAILHGSRSHKQISVRRGRDEHALARLSGQREHRVPRERAHGLVEQHVLPAPQSDMKERIAEERGNALRARARTVDDDARRNFPSVRRCEPPAVRTFLRPCDFKSAQELCAVVHRVPDLRNGQRIGADNSARRGQQSAGHPVGKIGFQLFQLLAGNEFQTLHAVSFAPLFQLHQRAQFPVRKRHDQRSVLPVLHPQFLRVGGHQFVSPDVEARFQSAFRGVKPRMHDSGIGLALAHADIVFLFQQADVTLVFRQLPEDGPSDDSAADDDYVKHFISPFPDKRLTALFIHIIIYQNKQIRK